MSISWSSVGTYGRRQNGRRRQCEQCAALPLYILLQCDCAYFYRSERRAWSRKYWKMVTVSIALSCHQRFRTLARTSSNFCCKILEPPIAMYRLGCVRVSMISREAPQHIRAALGGAFLAIMVRTRATVFLVLVLLFLFAYILRHELHIRGQGVCTPWCYVALMVRMCCVGSFLVVLFICAWHLESFQGVFFPP